jgi:hypothetical protein
VKWQKAESRWLSVLRFRNSKDGLEYDENPNKLPDAIELKDGLPILVGLVSQYPVTQLNEKKAPCGREIGANAYEATRVDYYHDCIFSKIKEMCSDKPIS